MVLAMGISTIVDSFVYWIGGYYNHDNYSNCNGGKKMKQEQIKAQEQISNLRSWIEPKQVQIHTLEQNLELQTLIQKHSQINVKEGWYVKQKEKEVKEAKTDMARKMAELNLKKTESDVKNGTAGAVEQITLDELKIQLKIEQAGLKALEKQIISLGRNGKLTETTKEPTNKVARDELDVSREAQLNEKEVK